MARPRPSVESIAAIPAQESAAIIDIVRLAMILAVRIAYERSAFYLNLQTKPLVISISIRYKAYRSILISAFQTPREQ